MAGREPARQANTTPTEALRQARQSEADAEEALTTATNKMAVFQAENVTTYEEFKDLGMESTRPIFDEFKSLFLSHSGDYHQSVCAYMAARVLNPMEAAKMALKSRLSCQRPISL